MRSWRPLLLVLIGTAVPAAALSDAKRWTDLIDEVKNHVAIMSEETAHIFVYFCKPANPMEHRKSLAQGEVNVPSCKELKDVGMEQYYGNFNLLLAEAWRSKISGALESLRLLPAPLTRRPAADLLLVREPSDGMVAGGIFVGQLLKGEETELANVGMMIGIHRGPKHKMLKAIGRKPRINVTNEIAAAAKKWTLDQGLDALYVCPLEGDDGSLRRRLTALGFTPLAGEEVTHALSLRFGASASLDEICEEAPLMGFRPQAGTKTEL